MEPNFFGVNYLLVDELDYELFVRSAVVQGSVDVKRAILRGYLHSEKDTTVSYPEVHVDFLQEQQICNEKLNAVEGMISNFSFDKGHPNYKRIKTRLYHIRNRLTHFPDDSSLSNIKTEFFAKFALLLDALESKALSQKIPEVSLIDLDYHDNHLGSTPDRISNLQSPESNRNMSHILSEPQQDLPASYTTACSNIYNTNDYHVSSSLNYQSTYIDREPSCQTTLPSSNVQNVHQPSHYLHTSTMRGLDNVITTTSSHYNTVNSQIPLSVNSNSHYVNAYRSVNGVLNHLDNHISNQPNFNTRINTTSLLQQNQTSYPSINAVNSNNVPVHENQKNFDPNLYYKIGHLVRNNLKFNGQNQSLHSFLEKIE